MSRSKYFKKKGGSFNIRVIEHRNRNFVKMEDQQNPSVNNNKEVPSWQCVYYYKKLRTLTKGYCLFVAHCECFFF